MLIFEYKFTIMIKTPKAILDKSGRTVVSIWHKEPKVFVENNVEMPTNESVSDEEVLNVWADRAENPQDIARDIRERNRQTDKT